jgi:uncharacterized membrane protein
MTELSQTSKTVVLIMVSGVVALALVGAVVPDSRAYVGQMTQALLTVVSGVLK